MGKKFVGGAMVTVGVIGALSLLFAFFTFSHPGYEDAPMYTPFILFGIVFVAFNLLLGFNVSKEWAALPTAIFGVVCTGLFLWIVMMGQTSQNLYVRAFTIFFPIKNPVLLILYLACTVVSLTSMSSNKGA